MKVVLFDIDHTVMATASGANAEASRVMFQKLFGLDSTEDDVEKVGKTERGLIEEVLASNKMSFGWDDLRTKQVPDKVFQTWAEALETELEGKVSKIEPGIPELLKALSGVEGIKLGLLTGNSYWRSEVKLRHVGLDGYFRERTGRLVGAFGNEARTREGLVAFATDRLVFDNDGLALVDDSLLGVKMAKEHGIPMVAVATGHASVEELSECTPYVFPDFGEERWKKAYEIIVGLGGQA